MSKSKNSAKAQLSALPVEEAESPINTKRAQVLTKNLMQMCHSMQSDHKLHPISLQTHFKPYREGPHMDWTVNDGLFHRFLKWSLNMGTY